MNFKFELTTIEKISELMAEYIKTLSSPFDSFLEDHIIASDFYKIVKGSVDIGYFSIFEKNLLTQFHIEFKYLKYAQEVFGGILDKFSIEEAYVCTADELFLSCICDIENKEIKNQAYFFQDNKENPELVKPYEGGVLRLAESEDIEIIKEISGDFFEDVPKQVEEKEIFIFTEGEEILGFGITEKGQVLQGYTSIGMFTSVAYRKKGIGKAIITKLKKLCYENGEIPICGCWYYNINSKKTLESCGFVTKTRLLKVKFI